MSSTKPRTIYQSMSDLCKDDIAGGNPPNKPTNNPRWCTFNWYQWTSECIVANQTDSEKTELWTGKSRLWRFIDGKIMENPWKSWNSMVHFFHRGFSKSPVYTISAWSQRTVPIPMRRKTQWLHPWHLGWWMTYPSEKWRSSSVGVTIPNIWKNKKKGSKPPSSINYGCYPFIMVVTLIQVVSMCVGQIQHPWCLFSHLCGDVPRCLKNGLHPQNRHGYLGFESPLYLPSGYLT